MFKTLDDVDRKHGIIWRFDTAQYTVAFWAETEYHRPEDSFEFPEDIEFATTGDFAHWFCAFVGVFKGTDGENSNIWKGESELVAYDCLGGCSYNSFPEFCGFRSGSRAGTKLQTGGYFPDMVRQALSEARAHQIRLTMTV